MRLAARIVETSRPPFDFAVIDEAQDVSIAQLQFLAAIGGSKPDALFLAGDLGQRIFQQPFSWKALGVDVRGRSAKHPGGRDGEGGNQGGRGMIGSAAQRRCLAA